MTCPNGHELKIKDHWAGKSGRCPKCRAPIQVPAVTEDDILDMIGDYAPEPKAGGEFQFDDEDDDKANVLDDFEKVLNSATSGLSLLKSSIVRHEKKCKACGSKAELWIAKCPDCGEFFDE